MIKNKKTTMYTEIKVPNTAGTAISRDKGMNFPSRMKIRIFKGQAQRIGANLYADLNSKPRIYELIKNKPTMYKSIFMK